MLFFAQIYVVSCLIPFCLCRTANLGTLLEEVAVVKQLDHPNIMKLYEFFEDRRNFYLVMDVYKGGELFDEIVSKQKFTEADAAK